mgnify:FL=1
MRFCPDPGDDIRACLSHRQRLTEEKGAEELWEKISYIPICQTAVPEIKQEMLLELGVGKH